jgi:hypothetical protein
VKKSNLISNRIFTKTAGVRVKTMGDEVKYSTSCDVEITILHHDKAKQIHIKTNQIAPAADHFS